MRKIVVAITNKNLAPMAASLDSAKGEGAPK